jgi:hypothetical protein
MKLLEICEIIKYLIPHNQIHSDLHKRNSVKNEIHFLWETMIKSDCSKINQPNIGRSGAAV